MSESKAFLSVRVDSALREELQQAAQVEHRSLSSLSRLLLEYAWNEYLKAGSMRELLSTKENLSTRRE